MKPSIYPCWGLLLVLASAFTACKRSQAEDITPQMLVDQVMTIEALRALTGNSLPNRIYIMDPKINGIFRLDPTDRQSRDNTGIILVTADGKRYKREFSGPASAAWFGVDELDDDIGPELQVAIDATNDIAIPDGQYTQLTRVYLRSNLTIRAASGRAVIKMPKGYVSLGSGDPNKPLENVMIDGLAWNTTSDQEEPLGLGRINIDGPSVNNLTVQNCTNIDQAAKAETNWFFLKVQSGKSINNITIKNNSSQAKRMACEIINHDNISIYSGKNIVVKDNYFYSCQFGISLSGTLEGLIVDNNHLKDCSLYGIEIAGAARSTEITNNRFEGKFWKIFAGSNDGGGNGTVTGGMKISDNATIGHCTGGIQLYNGGAVAFTNNLLTMSGVLEIGHATWGGTFTGNIIESIADKAVVCDNSPNNTFTRNVISIKNAPQAHTAFLAYGSKATNNTLTHNTLIKGKTGFYIDALLGATYKASMNYDEAGKLIP